MADAEFTTEERWLPVRERPDAYEVSDAGRVRSVDRQIIDKAGRRFRRRGQIVRPQNLKGYLYHKLWLDGAECRRLTHRLVFDSFVGPVPPGHEVNHIDGIKTNNRPCNLELSTRRENCAHAVRLGLMASGEKSRRAQITDAQALDAFTRWRSGERQVDLAAELGVSHGTVFALTHGRAWNHVTGLSRR